MYERTIETALQVNLLLLLLCTAVIFFVSVYVRNLTTSVRRQAVRSTLYSPFDTYCGHGEHQLDHSLSVVA